MKQFIKGMKFKAGSSQLLLIITCYTTFPSSDYIYFEFYLLMILCCASLSHKLLCINNFMCYTCQVTYVHINRNPSSLNQQGTHDGILRPCSWEVRVRVKTGRA